MDSQQSLRIVHNELLRRGLPIDYVERVVSELADHADDLAAEPAGDALTITPQRAPRWTTRLGNPAQLAAGIAREFQRRTFLGRHPWLAFVVLPIGAIVTAWIAAAFSISCVVELLFAVGGETPVDGLRWTAAIIIGALSYGTTYGVSALLCWWIWRKVRQTTRSWAWAWGATAALLLTSFVFRFNLFYDANGQFGIDTTGILRAAISFVFFRESLPLGTVPWRLLWAGSLSLGYLAQVVILVGATAWVSHRCRQALAAT